MPGRFEKNGIRFQYPENWVLEEEETENGWTVFVQSPNTTFFLLSYHEDMPPREQVLESILVALRVDYPDLEMEERVESIAGQPAVGQDIQFTSLDLTNSCWTRAFYTDTATVLVMCQATDLDLEKSEPVLRAMCASLQVKEEMD